jgi:hypothetical protein
MNLDYLRRFAVNQSLFATPRLAAKVPKAHVVSAFSAAPSEVLIPVSSDAEKDRRRS